MNLSRREVILLAVSFILAPIRFIRYLRNNR